jgi:hypothetical protein
MQSQQSQQPPLPSWPHPQLGAVAGHPQRPQDVNAQSRRGGVGPARDRNPRGRLAAEQAGGGTGGLSAVRLAEPQRRGQALG